MIEKYWQKVKQIYCSIFLKESFFDHNISYWWNWNEKGTFYRKQHALYQLQSRMKVLIQSTENTVIMWNVEISVTYMLPPTSSQNLWKEPKKNHHSSRTVKKVEHVECLKELIFIDLLSLWWYIFICMYFRKIICKKTVLIVPYLGNDWANFEAPWLRSGRNYFLVGSHLLRSRHETLQTRYSS